jgi:hypothetical protein
MSNPLLKYCIIEIASLLVMFGHISFSPVNGITNESCLIESKSSVTTSDNTKDNSASKVLDGNMSTRWTSASKDAWLEIDLGKNMRVCFVDISWFNGEKSIPFVISVSSVSGADSKVVFAGKTIATMSELERYDFQDVSARYLKISFASNKKSFPGITELSLYTYHPTDRSSRLPVLPNLPLYDNFENKSNTDNKWSVLYTGHGLASIITEKDDVNVYQMYPKKSTSAKETHATLVSSKDKFSNFRLVVDVRTDLQLRQNSEPNMWEAAWIFFRYTDTFHYYWFSLKPNGFELGKKDCNSCVDPTDGQIILYTAALPTLKISQWSQWTIEAVDNNIIVSIDGNKIITFKDKNMSKELNNGEIAMYSEDAKVSFDNFYLSPIKMKTIDCNIQIRH